MKNNIKKTKLSNIISLPKIEDEAYLCFAESNKHIPFEIKRVYYIFDVLNNSARGRHAHKKTDQILFCIRGKVKICLDNGRQKEEIILANPNEGIFLGKMMWHEMTDFTKDAVLLVFASDYYHEEDYIRSYEEFKRLKK